ncbi:MAG: toll/interleukin-1 receptor domain-containing protein [Bacteroidota bacterium]
MNFEYACFISYRHLKGDMKSFVDKFYDRLSEKLSFVVQNDELIFLDRNRMEVGDIVDEEIADALSKSCCMIVIYTKNYLSEDHPYCARELATMLNLESQRRKALGQPSLSLIIPVVISGEQGELPSVISDRKYSTDFIFARIIGTQNFKKKHERKFEKAIQKIANRVETLLDTTKNYDVSDLENYKLLDVSDERVMELFAKEILAAKPEDDRPYPK